MVEVADSDLVGRTTVPVACSNEVSGENVSINLAATPTPGVFRGVVFLLKTNQAAGASRLRVKDGDIIAAEYMDASANSKVQAAAEIDLGLPAVSNVAVQPDYENAMITWNTDEETDSLVQFGESTFLGKTVYTPSPPIRMNSCSPLCCQIDFIITAWSVAIPRAIPSSMITVASFTHSVR